MDREFNARVSFYQQCLQKGYTDMNDETQSLKAKVIAMDLGLPIRNVDVLFQEAKADYEASVAEKEKLRQEEENERKRRAVNGEWVMSVYNFGDESEEEKDKKTISIYRRPDGSLYYTVNNGGKNEGRPAFSAEDYKQVSYKYNEGKVVYTGATSGGISMGGTHTVGPSVSERWADSGKGKVMVQLGTDEPFWIKRATFPAIVSEHFHRESIYTKYVSGNDYPLMASYVLLKRDSDLLSFMAQNSSKYSTYDHISMRSVALGNMLYTISTCKEMCEFLDRVCRADYPETDAARFARISVLTEDANSGEIMRVIEGLKELIGYKPADEMRRKLQVRYEDVLQREKEEEVIRREQDIIRREKAEAKWRKIRPFLIGTVAAAIAITVLFITVVVPFVRYNDKYEEALEFLASEQYDQAKSIFEQLDNYKKSEELAKESAYRKGVDLLGKEQFDAAHDVFALLAEYKDSGELSLESIYRKGNALIAAGEYDEAHTAFQSLNDYKDSESLGKESLYKKAFELLDANDGAQALVTFARIMDYKDAKEKCDNLWDQYAVRNNISIGSFHVVGKNNDGSVEVVSWDYGSDCDVKNWSRIVSVSVGKDHIVGLKEDGTVVAVGDNDNGQCDVDDWNDIVSIYATDDSTLGIKSNGTVVATTDFLQDCVDQYNEIIAVACGTYHWIGLKADGTVIAFDKSANNEKQCEFQDWQDIVAIDAAADHTVGLKGDGTVVVTGNSDYGACDVGGWTDIVSIATSYGATVGLKADGTVVACGSESFGVNDAKRWRDIVAISVGNGNIVGLKANGTVVAAGQDTDDWLDVSSWKNIRVEG